MFGYSENLTPVNALGRGFLVVVEGGEDREDAVWMQHSTMHRNGSNRSNILVVGVMFSR